MVFILSIIVLSISIFANDEATNNEDSNPFIEDFNNINVQIIDNEFYITFENTYTLGMYDTNTSYTYSPGENGYFKFVFNDNGRIKKGTVYLKYGLIPLKELLEIIN
jgi:hypothetical protein